MLDSSPARTTSSVPPDIKWPDLAARYGAEPIDAFNPAQFVAGMFNAESVLDGLDDDAVSAVMQVCHNNLRLFFGFTPSKLDGDVLVFSATKGRDHKQTAKTWIPYVTGDVEEYEVPVSHEEMTTPEALREIGLVLNDRLRKLGQRP